MRDGKSSVLSYLFSFCQDGVVLFILVYRITLPHRLIQYTPALILGKSIPVNFYVLSSIPFFFCQPLLPFPFTVLCRIVFAKPDDLEMWPNHVRFRFLTLVSCSLMEAWIFLQTSSRSRGPCARCSVKFRSITSQRSAFFSLYL